MNRRATTMQLGPFILGLACLTPIAYVHAADPAELDDPYINLEEVTGDAALAWVREQNAVSTAELAGSDAFKALEARLLAIYDSNQKIPYVNKAGDYYYNFWKDADHRRGLWRRTTLEEYRKAEPAWETVLDLDALGTAEGENWVWKGASFLRPECKRCLIELSRGGADATVTREFDLTTKAFVLDGFVLPEGKNDVSWRSIDSVFVGADWGPGSLTVSGYPRVVKAWTRGTPLPLATVVYEANPDDISAAAFRDLTPGYERDFVQREITSFTNELYLLRGGKQIKIEKPVDASASVKRDLLVLELRSDWSVGGTTYPTGALIATDFEAFLAGERRFEVFFEPGERKSLVGFSRTKNHILVTEMENVISRVYLLARENDTWRREPLPGVPAFSTVRAQAIDPDESDAYFMNVGDFLTPSCLYYGTAGAGPSEKIKSLPAFFDATGLAVSQHEAVSADGTRIPYFQVARESMALDGTNPTLLYGYGGFEVPMFPSYEAGKGAAWFERGAVYVVANIRGGGEFGPKWHQAALQSNKTRSYEDFIAVAEDLVRRKVTSPPKLAVLGGSNGGLLVGNMLTMRPDLFGAIVCAAPLLDMRRYSHLLAGASWTSEYGDPDLPEEWEFIRTFSPYHNVKADAKYPRTLFLTSTRDDRVHPAHARKMVAKMKGMGHDVLYYENIEGGHAGAADNKQQAFMSALTYTFLERELGMGPAREAAQSRAGAHGASGAAPH